MNNAFENIAGYPAEKEELKKLCDIFVNREKYLKKGAKMPKGIIFYGEAGTGKTLFARVLAEECGLYTYKIDIADMDNSVRICRKIKKVFDRAAKRMQPSMIFFDELDKLLPNAEEEYYTDQAKMILAQLLTLIDGMGSSHNFIFVATCNSYGNLPETLVRPGRIDKKISIGKPTYKSRAEILQYYADNSSCKFEIGMDELAGLCSGFTCSALETLINECVLRSDDYNCVSKKLITEKILEIKQEDIPRKTSGVSDTINACRNIGYFVVAKSFNKGQYLLNLEDDNLSNNFFNKILSEYDRDYEDDDYYADDDDDYDEEDDNFDIDLENREITEYIEEHGDDFLHENEANKYFSKTDLMHTICVLCGGLAAEQVVFHRVYDNLCGDLSNIYAILVLLWALTIPLWTPFYRYAEGLENAYEIFLITIKLAPFYISYAGCAIIDNFFVGTGHTIYNAINSLIINLVYYGIFFILYLTNTIIFTMDVIILMFGFGMVVHLIISVMEERLFFRKRELKKLQTEQTDSL